MYDPASYTLIVPIFCRLLGFIYFFAFGAFLFQIRGLLGDHGILPVKSFLERIKKIYRGQGYWIFPTLFWWNCSNQALMGVTALGTGLSVALMLGYYPALMLVLLYILYLSIVSAGQEFLGFGWEGFLLEITAHAFLLSLSVVPNPMVWVSINFLLFRFHFMAGMVKLQSRDRSWRDFSALACHYQTQPLPNTLAWYVHKLPYRFHQLECVIMFVIELVVPFGIFMSEEVRLAVFIAFFGLQFMIWVSGNYSFLNYLTVVLSTILISNTYLTWLFGNPPALPTPLPLDIFLYVAGSALFALQLMRFYQHFAPNAIFRSILNTLGPYHLANRYGIFAVMTTSRYEIVIEGSEDGHIWKEYLFKHKPSELKRRPRRIAPYQPRLDWQAWFLPFTDFESERWFQSFMYHLLKGTPEVLALLRGNPFPDQPPKYVRAVVYLYEFSSKELKKQSGFWWKRTYVDTYSPVLALKTTPKES